MQSGGAIPPLQRGISAILARYPMKARQTGAIPPSAILSRKGMARYGGGISHWAAKGTTHFQETQRVRDKFLLGDFAPPEPEFGAEFWGTNFGSPNFGPEFLGHICLILLFPAEEALKFHPQEIHLPKFTFQNSTQKSGRIIHIAPLQGHLVGRGVQKFVGHKVPWKTGMLIYLPVTLQPLISCRQKSSFITLKLREHPVDSLQSEFLSPFRNAPHMKMWGLELRKCCPPKTPETPKN